MAITPISRYQWWYGCDEPPLIPRALRAGSVTARLVGRDLRSVRIGATEIAQRIYVALRDRNWGTVPGEITELVVDDGEDRFALRLTVTHRQHDIDLTWKGEIRGGPFLGCFLVGRPPAPHRRRAGGAVLPAGGESNGASRRWHLGPLRF